MADMETERIYTIPLRTVKWSSRNKRAPRAIDTIQAYLERHMKTKKIWIDAAVNEKIWERGMHKVPSRIRVRAVKFEDGVVEVSLPEEDVSKSIRSSLAEEREAKAPILAKPELEEEAPAEEKPSEEKPAEPAPEEPKPAPEEPKPQPEARKGEPEEPKAAKPSPAEPKTGADSKQGTQKAAGSPAKKE